MVDDQVSQQCKIDTPCIAGTYIYVPYYFCYYTKCSSLLQCNSDIFCFLNAGVVNWFLQTGFSRMCRARSRQVDDVGIAALIADNSRPTKSVFIYCTDLIKNKKRYLHLHLFL